MPQDDGTATLSFEQAMSQLEQVVRDLEDAQLGLDASLARYEQGVRLIKLCHAQLQQAEQRIQLLTAVEQGQPVLQPFKHEASTARTAPAAARLKKAGEDLPF